jgi:hypothetical protein
MPEVATTGFQKLVDVLASEFGILKRGPGKKAMLEL